MKKALAILGAVVLVLVLAIGGTIVHFSRVGRGLDESSKAYADSVVPLIVGSWSVDALEKHASPQALKVTNHDQWIMVFSKLSQLGALKHYDGAKGDSHISYTPKEGKVVSAKYVSHAQFENGDADIRITLIQIDNEWQIWGFYVNSPLFLK
jgi:hypothetical protein